MADWVVTANRSTTVAIPAPLFRADFGHPVNTRFKTRYRAPEKQPLFSVDMTDRSKR